MRVDHLQLAMPPGEEAKAGAFFSRVLGMDPEEKPSPLNARGGCWFRKGCVILHLGVEREFVPQKKAHPAFLVEDLEALATRLTAANHPVTWDDTLPGRARFYTTDPFGNRLEFMREGDGFSQR